MTGYVGWVNELLDHHKSDFKEAVEYDKVRNKLDAQTLDFTEFMEDLYKLCTQSIKFKLPLDAKLFEYARNKKVKDSLTELTDGILHLPFPMIALEFFTTNADGECPMVVLAEEQEEAISLKIALKGANSWKTVECIKIYINRATFDLEFYFSNAFPHVSDEEKTASLKSMEAYIHQAYIAVAQLLCALACSNVTISDHGVNPSPLKQNMRRNKKKLPLYTYKVLTVRTGQADSDVIRLDANDNEDHTSTLPGSKRSHLRRGHPRKYKTGLKIWVYAFSVGNKKLGEVAKSYNITA